MSKSIITVENLGKKYSIGDKQNFYTLRDTVAGFFNGKKKSGEEFWALKDINFEVEPGESIGIIGKNGAGKSTLLKILSQITPPTTGKVVLHGRVSSLLEVGTGFHQELSGRENIFLNGAILGMSRTEIKKKFDEIVAFSEVEKFLDMPVKHYSSGMYMRLAFAVAAHLESEILIVDEVLAVGDVQFQKKCMGKMNDISKNDGRTVLFVSHNLQAIQNFCKKTILLEQGKMVGFGLTNKISRQYLSKGASEQISRLWESPETAPGNKYVKIKSAKVVNSMSKNEPVLTVKTPIAIEFDYWNYSQTKLNLSLVLRSISGECIFNVATDSKRLGKGVYRSSCLIPGDFLNDNKYTVQILFIRESSSENFNYEDILSFEVHDLEREGWYGKWPGAVRPKLQFETVKL